MTVDRSVKIADEKDKPCLNFEISASFEIAQRPELHLQQPIHGHEFLTESESRDCSRRLFNDGSFKSILLVQEANKGQLNKVARWNRR